MSDPKALEAAREILHKTRAYLVASPYMHSDVEADQSTVAAALEAYAAKAVADATEELRLALDEARRTQRIARTVSLTKMIDDAVAAERQRCADIAREAENTHRGVESIALEIEASAAEAFCGPCGWRGKQGHIHSCRARSTK